MLALAAGLFAVTVVVTSVGGAAAGAVWMRKHLAAQKDPHEHVWEPWVDCELLKTVPMAEPITIGGQKRVCLSCGEKQVRRVRP